MKNLRENWPIYAVMGGLFLAMGILIYWFNCVYLPQKAASAGMSGEEIVAMVKEQDALRKAGTTPTYDYTITPTPVEETKPDNSGSNVTVTENDDGSVTIDRNWKVDTSDYAKTPADPATMPNIAGGGEELPVDENDVYTEPVEEPEPPVETPVEPPKTPAVKTPKSGDMRIVDGQEQLYNNYFGWVDYGGPGVGVDRYDPNFEMGGIEPNASF